MMRRLGVALATTLALAGGTLVGSPPAAAAAPVALGGCGWQPTLASMNTPTSLRANTLSLSGFAPVQIPGLDSGHINWAYDPYNDPTWRLWFDSLKWMESLVTSDNPTDLTLARALVTDFLANNPDPGSNTGAWLDHATSFRTSLLVCMWQHTEGNTEFRSWLEPILRQHAAAVLNRYVGPWNHGTMQSLALLAAGCVLDEAPWRDAAAARLRNELLSDVDAQGAITEQAPGYAAFIWTLQRDAQAHQAACNMPVDNSLYQRVEMIDTFAAQATRPGGTKVEIGDTFNERVEPGLGPNSLWVATGGAQGVMPSDLIKVYNAGYVFGRDSWTSPTQEYTLRFGPGRYTHGHNDHMAMTYWSQGHDVLVDSGYDGYADRAYRTWSRGLQAHNVPIVSGVKFNSDATTQLVDRSYTRGTHAWHLRDHAFAGAQRDRTVLVDDSMKLMVVRDDVKANRARALQTLWHLDPSWHKERVHNTARTSVASFLSADRRYRTSIIQLAVPGTKLPSNAASVVRGHQGPAFQGFVSRHRGDRTPDWVVETHRGAAKVQNVITLIVVSPVSERVRATWTSPHGHNRIRVAIGRHVRVYNTSRGHLSPK